MNNGFILAIISGVFSAALIPLVVYIWKRQDGRIVGLEKWRLGMLEHGGPLLRNEHMAACKEIIEKTSNNFAEKLEEKFDFQREWVTQELRAMLADIRLLIISSEKKTSSSK